MPGYMETRKAYTEYFKPPSFSYHIKASNNGKRQDPKGLSKTSIYPKALLLAIGLFCDDHECGGLEFVGVGCVNVDCDIV